VAVETVVGTPLVGLWERPVGRCHHRRGNHPVKKKGIRISVGGVGVGGGVA